jgi:hypothetical protein
MGVLLLFVAIKAGRFPVPPDARPIDELSFVQLYVTVPTPVAFDEKFTAVVAA